MHSNKSLFLTIDQGGHATRTMVFDMHGDIVHSVEFPIQTQHPAEHFVEHSADALLDSIRQGLKAIAIKLGDDLKYVDTAGLATQRSNAVCWDKHTGQALSPVISWQDTRALDIMRDLKLEREDVHKTTGLFPSAHYGASKLQWCLRHLDAVKQAQQQERLYLGPMSSYLVFNLVKEKHCYADPVSASRTLLWHIHRRDWDKYLLDTFAIPKQLLPRCVPTCYEYGHIEVGDKQIPLRVVTGDQSAAMYAYGDLQFETAYVNLGTGAFVSRPSGYSLIYARRLLTSVIYSDTTENQYVLEGTVNGAGSAIDWLQTKQPVADLWDKLPRWLNEVTNPPLFINGVSGLAAPYWIPDFVSEYQESAKPEENYVALIESIVFLLNANVQEMMKFASPPQQLQISGGLSRLDGLCQRLADLSRLPIYRPIECEATARGTAYLAAGRPTHWPETRHGHWFKPMENAILDARFLLWESSMLQRMRTEDE